MLQDGERSKPHSSIVGLNAPEKLEASTETPLHFTDGRIDTEYHWNEWVLRRRALQAANIQHCTTKLQQTDSSHFRRENDTQVYLSRTKHTQTKKSSGSKPSQTVQYFAGEFSTFASYYINTSLPCSTQQDLLCLSSHQVHTYHFRLSSFAKTNDCRSHGHVQDVIQGRK